MRVDKGDEQAFRLIFERYQQKIYALAFHLTESAVYAEEIVQDVFLKIWVRQGQLREIEDFQSYLFITARNHIYSYIKAIARHQIVTDKVELFIPSDTNNPETQAAAKEFTTLVQQAAGLLPPQQYQVYKLSKEDGKSRDQISRQLNISPETVKVHLARAMRFIRAHVLSRMPVIIHLVVLVTPKQ